MKTLRNIRESFFDNIVKSSDKTCESILSLIEKIVNDIKKKYEDEIPDITRYLAYNTGHFNYLFLSGRSSLFKPTIKEIENILIHTGECELFTCDKFTYKGCSAAAFTYFHDANEKRVNRCFNKANKGEYTLNSVSDMTSLLILYMLAGVKISY